MFFSAKLRTGKARISRRSQSARRYNPLEDARASWSPVPSPPRSPLPSTSRGLRPSHSSDSSLSLPPPRNLPPPPKGPPPPIPARSPPSSDSGVSSLSGKSGNSLKEHAVHGAKKAGTIIKDGAIGAGKMIAAGTTFGVGTVIAQKMFPDNDGLKDLLSIINNGTQNDSDLGSDRGYFTEEQIEKWKIDEKIPEKILKAFAITLIESDDEKIEREKNWKFMFRNLLNKKYDEIDRNRHDLDDEFNREKKEWNDVWNEKQHAIERGEKDLRKKQFDLEQESRRLEDRIEKYKRDKEFNDFLEKQGENYIKKRERENELLERARTNKPNIFKSEGTTESPTPQWLRTRPELAQQDAGDEVTKFDIWSNFASDIKKKREEDFKANGSNVYEWDDNKWWDEVEAEKDVKLKELELAAEKDLKLKEIEVEKSLNGKDENKKYVDRMIERKQKIWEKKSSDEKEKLVKKFAAKKEAERNVYITIGVVMLLIIIVQIIVCLILCCRRERKHFLLNNPDTVSTA